ncbi:MAG: S-layer homology domain-containing protein, partial [Clostridia bacterium]|nr:S-layer homology domain-containing protein [Clostridia bacterium]
MYVDDEYITEELAADAAVILVDFSKENTMTVGNVGAVINKAVAIAGVNAGVITYIIGEARIFDLDNSKIKDVYQADYVNDTTKQDVVTRMREKNCTSIDAFDETLVDEFVLAVVANPVRPGSIAAVSELVGLSGYNSAAYSSVANQVYSSLEDLENALDRYMLSSSSSAGSNGGGSGGSSGGGSGVTSGSYQIANSGVTTSETDTKTNTETNEIFKDLQGYDWAKNSIEKLYRDGIVSGTGAGIFEPGRMVNREEFVKLLCEAFGYGKGGNATSFDDVAENAWYVPYVSRAVELGMVKGVSENAFGSGTQISREDMAVIIYRALLAENKELYAKSTGFTDGAEIADYAKEAVEMLAGAGIVNGVGDGRFAPKASASRAEAAVIILRCIEKFSL